MINLKKRETIEGFGGKKRNDVLILKSQKKKGKKLFANLSSIESFWLSTNFL